MDFWTFDRCIISNAHDYQVVIRVHRFWTQGTEVYSTTDNYFDNGQHEKDEFLENTLRQPSGSSGASGDKTK